MRCMGTRASRSQRKQSPTKSWKREISTKDERREVAKAKRGAKPLLKRPGHTSRYFNVTYSSRDQSYAAEITIAGHSYWLGAWSSERDAAVARDRAPLYFGIEDVPLNIAAARRSAGPPSPPPGRPGAQPRRQRREDRAQYFCGTRLSCKN